MLFRVHSADERPVPAPWFRQYGHELVAQRATGKDRDVWDVACEPGPVEVGADGFSTTEVTAHADWFRRFIGSWLRHTHVRLTPLE